MGEKNPRLEGPGAGVNAEIFGTKGGRIVGLVVQPGVGSFPAHEEADCLRLGRAGVGDCKEERLAFRRGLLHAEAYGKGDGVEPGGQEFTVDGVRRLGPWLGPWLGRRGAEPLIVGP
jgi:hypothetical protein